VRLRAGALIAFCLLAAQVSIAAEPRSGYYKDSQKGWWWGDRSVEEKQEEQPEPQQPEPQQQPEQQKPEGPWVPPPLSAYKYDDIWNMHPDDFYELQEAYKKKAVQTPTEDNTRDYYELSEIARKKALAFTNSSQYVWQKYPELTVAKDYPVTTPGNLSRVSSTAGEKQAVLQSNRERYALVYFWRPGCSYCDAQSKILKWFEQQNGWIVKPVNINENPPAAAKVGVEITPTIVLIKKGEKDYFPVSSGVVSADELEDKTYRAVRLLNGEIGPEEYSIHDFQKGGGFDVNGRKDWVRRKGGRN